MCSATKKNKNPPDFSAVTSHIALAHSLLREVLRKGDTVVDATVGNGIDACKLAELVVESSAGRGQVIGLDVQKAAISATEARLRSKLGEEGIKAHVTLIEANHRDLTCLDGHLPAEGANAFVYNLGFLPGSDRTVKTATLDTVASLRSAYDRTKLGGLIVVTCYTGHDGGEEESAAVRRELASWPQSQWRVCEHRPLNWELSPTVLTAYRFLVPRLKLPAR